MTKSSILTSIPENTNFLQSAKYTLTFDTLPYLKYFCTAINLPGVSTSPVSVETPFSNTFRHGDKLVYEPIVVTVIVDEDLRVWEESYNWLRSLTFPHEFPEYVRTLDKKKVPYHDAVLTLNTNSNNPNLRIKYFNCHPISISGINFSMQVNADTTIACDITFRYDTFKIER